MKTSAKIVVMLLSLPLEGCYNILLVNVGGVTKQASSIGQPMLAPDVQCAALTEPTVNAPGISVEAAKICMHAVATQKAIDARKQK